MYARAALPNFKTDYFISQTINKLLNKNKQMKKLFTLLTLLVALVTSAWASTVDDLVTISSNYTFIADNITSNGTVKLTANTLYDNGYIFAPTANTVATNKGSVTFGGASHLNSLRLKNTQDQLCFKVAGPCTVTFYSQSHAERGIQVGSAAGGTQYGSQTASTSEWSCNITAAGVVYLSSYEGDFYFAGFKVAFPKPEITTQPVGGTYVSGYAIPARQVVAVAPKGELSYQWYSCDDANKTNAAAISGATSASYVPTASGFLFCRVTDDNGYTDTNVIEIIIAPAAAPAFVDVIASATSVMRGTASTITAEVSGNPEPTIQWYSCDDAVKTNPVAIDGATSLTLNLANTVVGTFYYYAVASNSEGNATSNVVTLTVNPLYTVTYSLGEVTGTVGTVPAAVEVESALTIPVNKTLYKDGYTLTAWNDGSADHAIGSNMAVTANKTLTPVFTANGVNAHIGYNTTTVTWDFQTKNGAPTWALEGAGQTGVQVAQTTVGGSSIDVKLDIDATSGKFNNASNNDWAQTNSGTKLTVPVLNGAVVKLYVYQEGSSAVTFGGNAGTYASNIYSYTATADGDLEIVIGDQSYSRYLSVTYPSESAVLTVYANNTIVPLTKANINSVDYLTVSTDNWATGKTYGGYTGDFYNMSTTSRVLAIKVTGANIFEAFVRNDNNTETRTFKVKVGDADAVTVSAEPSTLKSTGIFAIADPTATTTITLTGGTSSTASVYPVYAVFNPTVAVTIASSGYSTLASAYALDFSKATPAGLEAYVASAITASGVTLNAVTEAPASTGIILKGTPGETYNIPVKADAAAVGTNYLHAAVAAYNCAANEVYILKGGKFCKVTAASTVPAGKAYLLASDVPASAPELEFNFGGTTGIKSVDSGQLTVDSSEVYNLAGQRVAQPTKGLYIVNGRKVVIK